MNRRKGTIFAAMLPMAGFAPTADARHGGPAAAWAGIWCWGSPRRSADVPFLRITANGGAWRVETKHYMHDSFETNVKDVEISGDRLTFAYWYAPRQRWAKCALTVSGDRMTGMCEGEANARDWGDVPSYLWRCDGVAARE